MKRGQRLFAAVRGGLEIILVLLVGVFLFIALSGSHPAASIIRDYIVANGETETGALNLITSIYLGFRAFDTLGETIVLLLAVSGVLYLTGGHHGEE